MSIINFALFVSIPEETLLLIMTLLIMGKGEHLNLKNKSNVIKMLSAITLTILFSVIQYNFLEQYEFMMMVQVVFFIIVYWLVYKMNFFEVFLGFLLALIIFIVLGEILGTLILELLTGINNVMLQEYSNKSIYIAMLLPRRVLQIIVSIVLYKLGGITNKIWFFKNRCS
ncbi:MAG: hypothetical protein KAX49_19075 [Halanaerobiales bacterium]|nr:hypothetical protein [Halanaerobiales bacterium]